MIRTKEELKSYFETGDVPTEENFSDLIDTMITEEELDEKIEDISFVSLTYQSLLNLREENKLIPGRLYRITDYITTTTQENTQSAGHPFDVIVLALSGSELSEEAWAIQSARDTDGYFSNSALSGWKIWYSLDNDATRFAWADTENGKGVIYRMIDEWNNDCPYDFKNIIIINNCSFQYFQWGATYQFIRNESIDIVINDTRYYGYTSNIAPSAWSDGNCWTVDEIPSTNSVLYKNDGSVISYGGEIRKVNSIYSENYTFREANELEGRSKQNKIQPYLINGKSFINNITFGNNCHDNSFGNNCHDNTFGDECYSNSFEDECYSNSFEDECYYNTFGNNCHDNSFGNYCHDNTFANTCHSNSFGGNCFSNSFGNDCNNNSFGNDCNNNSFGNDCYSNSFGGNCFSNSFGGNCYSNSFEDECYYNTFGNKCNNNSFGDYCNNNSFGDDCHDNSFGNNCHDNSFGNNCDNNEFGINSQSNSFGNTCNNNSFGNNGNNNSFGNNGNNNSFGDNCTSNSFGNDCYSNSFGDNCRYNSFGNNCYFNSLGNCFRYNKADDGVSVTLNNNQTASPEQQVQNYHLTRGLTSKTIEVERNRAYETTVAIDSSGNVKQFCIADLV